MRITVKVDTSLLRVLMLRRRLLAAATYLGSLPFSLFFFLLMLCCIIAVKNDETEDEREIGERKGEQILPSATYKRR